MAKYATDVLARQLQIAQALGDPGRVRALMALSGGELCACQLTELLELAPSTVSRHMALLRSAGLVITRKQGRWAYYRLPDGRAPRPVREALSWLKSAVIDDERITSDARRLERIRRLSKEELCRRNG